MTAGTRCGPELGSCGNGLGIANRGIFGLIEILTVLRHQAPGKQKADEKAETSRMFCHSAIGSIIFQSQGKPAPYHRASTRISDKLSAI
jgi:hypothetical protein